jgi:hypothetical protein
MEQKKEITPVLENALATASVLFKEKFESRGNAGLKTVTKSKSTKSSARSWLNRKIL